MQKIRVFIADDHALFRDGTRNIITQEQDMEVVGEASDGEEAVNMVAKLRPNVVLMDIAMPKLNGIEATQRIKGQFPGMPVMVLTAYDNDQYVRALIEAGAAGYLLKDIKGTDLINAIRSVYSGEAVLHPVIASKIFKTLGVKQPNKGLPGNEDLSEREMEILRLAAKGLSNQEIARKLFLSKRTVQSHLANIFRKFEVGSRTEAIFLALKKGLLAIEDLS